MHIKIPATSSLWFVEFHRRPNARKLLVDYLGDPRRGPHYVAGYEVAYSCDPSGHVGRILRDDYRYETTLGPVDLLERRTATIPLDATATP